ncbi:MAG: IclR family transcriptional regulator [Candidatus Limnocylindrales bacterium]
MSTARDRPPEEAAEDSSLARGLRLLLAIADRGEIRADELSLLLETPLSTIYRYLRTLSEFGFVDRRGSAYGLGPRLLIGGGSIVSSERLIRLSDPILRLLSEETGETAVVCRRVGATAVCLHEIQSSHALRVTMEPGSGGPLHMGAIGQVLLAYAPPDLIEEVATAAQTTARPIADLPAWRAGLEAVARSVIARSDGEPDSGIVTMAVPIMRDDGIVGALAVSGPEARCGLAWGARVARLLPDAARTVEDALDSP